MMARVWNGSTPTELYGQIVELVWPDGRQVQLAANDSSMWPHMIHMRVWPSDGKGDFMRATVFSMRLQVSPNDGGGVEIHDMQTGHSLREIVRCVNCDKPVPEGVRVRVKGIELGQYVSVCGYDCKNEVEGAWH